MIAALGALGGGGGLSASSSASAQGGKSGDIGGSTFSFGGINTGSQSNIPAWVYPVAFGFVAVVAFIYFRKR